jgi:hypothetical protein
MELTQKAGWVKVSRGYRRSARCSGARGRHQRCRASSPICGLRFGGHGIKMSQKTKSRSLVKLAHQRRIHRLVHVSVFVEDDILPNRERGVVGRMRDTEGFAGFREPRQRGSGPATIVDQSIPDWVLLRLFCLVTANVVRHVVLSRCRRRPAIVTDLASDVMISLSVSINFST